MGQVCERLLRVHWVGRGAIAREVEVEFVVAVRKQPGAVAGVPFCLGRLPLAVPVECCLVVAAVVGLVGLAVVEVVVPVVGWPVAAAMPSCVWQCLQ